MKRPTPDDVLNKRLQRDLKHYILLCVFGEACAYAFMNAGLPLTAAYCAFIPACMIIMYLLLSPSCNRKGGNILTCFALTAISAGVIGTVVCLYAGPEMLNDVLDWKRFAVYCAASSVIFFIGITTGIFPLPPKRK